MSLAIGDAIPTVTLLDADGATIDLAAMKGAPLVVYFYPKADTPGCTNEGKDFSALIDAFADAGATIVAVSKDPVRKLDRFKAKHDLKVILASDEDGAACEAWGVWVQKKLYGREYMGIERATFLIGPDGVVARAWRNVRVPGHALQVLEAVRSLA